jgi:hypothetical protein
MNFQQFVNQIPGQVYVDEEEGAEQDYDEEEEDVDEDGQPIPSPEQISGVINSIQAFKYEQKS